jgi:hypothetical protein
MFGEEDATMGQLFTDIRKLVAEDNCLVGSYISAGRFRQAVPSGGQGASIVVIRRNADTRGPALCRE